MADEQIKAQIDISVLGERELNRVIDLLAELEDKGTLSQKKMQQLQKAAAQLSVSMRDLKGAVDGTTKSGASNLAVIERQEKAYRSYAESIRLANQAQRDAQGRQTAAMGSYASNMPTAVKGAQGQAYDSYAPNLRYTQQMDQWRASEVGEARKFAAQREQIEAQSRQRELGALRGAIEQRASLQDAQRRQTIETAQRTNAQSLQIAEQTRQRELTGLRNAIQERSRIQEQSSKAQVAYANQASRSGLRYGEEVGQSLITQRYALYDVAAAWGVVSAATLGAVAAGARVSIQYQKDFAQVQRTTETTGEAARGLRKDLVDLTTELPTSFTDIAGIATLGGQLNIAQQDIEDFTRITAQLAATTDLTSEAAGTAIGRFQALLGVQGPQFENLASSILKVGINSVATESQIVNISTQISSMGDFAGFTAEQVVGLSGALASVGAQPELSRGTVTRTFSLMSKAISEGGEDLDEFARVSGVSADQFRQAWGTSEFAGVFQGFIEGLNKEGGNAVQTLNDLGITSVRDVPLLLRLAGAGDLVNDAFSDAATGWAENSELTTQYGIIAETVSAKLTILANTLKAVVDAVGVDSLGPIASLLDVVQMLAEAFLAISRNPVGSFLLSLGAAVTLVIGLFAAWRVAQLLAVASLYAMQTANEALNSSMLKSGVAIKGLTGAMVAQTVGVQRAAAAQSAYNAALANGSGRIAAATAGMRGLTTATNGAATAGRAAGSAFVWTAVLGAGLTVLTSFSQAQAEAKARVEELTTTLDAQTGALTENTMTSVANSLEKSGALAAARELGLNLETVTQAALGEKDAMAEVQGAIDAVHQANLDAINGLRDYNREIVEAGDAANKLERTLGMEASAVDASRDAWERVAEARGDSTASADIAADATEDLTDRLQELLDAEYSVIGGTIGVQNALFGLGQSLAENGTSFDIFSVGGRANMEALQRTISTMVTLAGGDSAALATMLAGLMDSLAAYGVAAVNELAFVSNMINQLTGGKGRTGLVGVQNAAGMAGNALRQGFSAGAAKAAKSAGNTAKKAKEAAKEIRTLTDYVKDLEGVFSAAFDFRFGLDQATDGVAESYQKLVEYANDAAEAVQDAKQAIIEADAEIRGLQSERQILEYQLTVSQEYGDMLRTAEIMAELDKNSADLSDTQKDRTKAEKDLKKANEQTNKALDGSTEGSREQRDMVLDLLESYQAQIGALANTGMGQDELARKTDALKQQFIAQLTQMGYSRAETERYARSFDDLSFAIRNVPRNITVSANTNPAQRALDEFLAKAASSKATANVDARVAGVPTYTDGFNAGKDWANGWAAAQGNRKLLVQTDMSVPGNKRYSYDNGNTWFVKDGGLIGSGPQYLASGGVAGLHPGGPRGVDTTPAWLQPGEFVMRKSAVSHFGLPFMNALNSHQTPIYRASGGSVGRSGSTGPAIQLVELLPTQVQQIVDALAVEINLDGKAVAASVNRANSGAARRGSN